MSLIQPPRQLTSPIPRTHDRALDGSPIDFFRVVYWSLWSPMSLVSYIDDWLLEHHSQANVEEPKSQWYYALFFLRFIAFIITITLVTVIIIIFAGAISFFDLINPAFSPFTITSSLIISLVVVSATYLLCRFRIEDLGLSVASILTLGTANGLLFGLIALVYTVEADLFVATLIGICFGSTFGLWLSTFRHYSGGYSSGYLSVVLLSILIWIVTFIIFVEVSRQNALILFFTIIMNVTIQIRIDNNTTER